MTTRARGPADETEPKEQPWPLDWMPAFLAVLRNSANVRIACESAGISRRVVERAREKSTRFRAAWEEALEDAIDTLEAVAWKRAREQSDYLLWRLLASNRREKYGDAVTIKWDLEAEAKKLAEREKLSDEQASKIVSLAARLKARAAG